jgi:hypothetical protein
MAEAVSRSQAPGLQPCSQLVLLAGVLAAAWGCLLVEARGEPTATVQEMIDARTDVWGDAAMRQPNGASYEFFEKLLPPVRWVNTDFRHYPIVLGAPRSPHKSRLVSNGSAVNARAKSPPMWYELDTSVSFFVGSAQEPFGANLHRLAAPTYVDGYLPIVSIRYSHNDMAYVEEVFAPINDEFAAHGAAMLRFSIADGDGKQTGSVAGQVAARIESSGPLREAMGNILDSKGHCLVAFTPTWRWDAEKNLLRTKLKASETAELVVYTKPIAESVQVSPAEYNRRREECAQRWNDVLDRGIRLQTPEAIVNNAWRVMVIGNFMIAVGDQPHYSAQNAYAKLYEGESGDTLRSFLQFGHLDLARTMLRPMLEFDRQDTRFHVAGHKLQLLANFYWVTRDAGTIREYEPLWRPALELILTGREIESGLLPKDRYAGDIKENVYSLNSNANCWRGLRDVAAMLNDMGESDEAMRIQKVAEEYREKILAAVQRSEHLHTKPPFIPNALLADEPAHDPLTATRTGSYYDLMCPYIIGSEIFGQGSDREDWLIGYLQNHGGIGMGMPRVKPAQGIYMGEPGVNPLYGLRYQLALLRRDEREKALVGFYGQLAQGMTRGTFIGGEGNRFVHGDENGRSFYLPPNSTSNAAWLIVLRNLLVQDWDLDGDAKPETLRLMFAAPRRWFTDGKSIRVENAPTAFGPVSCRVESKLGEGYVEVKVTPPPRPVERILLRAPLPDGRNIESANVDGKSSELVNGNTVELSGRKGPLTVRFDVTDS